MRVDRVLILLAAVFKIEGSTVHVLHAKPRVGRGADVVCQILRIPQVVGQIEPAFRTVGIGMVVAAAGQR